MKRMRRSGTWATELEVTAAAHALLQPIHLITDHEDDSCASTVLDPPECIAESCWGPPVYLGHYLGFHFEGTLPVGNEDPVTTGQPPVSSVELEPAFCPLAAEAPQTLQEMLHDYASDGPASSDSSSSSSSTTSPSNAPSPTVPQFSTLDSADVLMSPDDLEEALVASQMVQQCMICSQHKEDPGDYTQVGDQSFMCSDCYLNNPQ